MTEKNSTEGKLESLERQYEERLRESAAAEVSLEQAGNGIGECLVLKYPVAD